MDCAALCSSGTRLITACASRASRLPHTQPPSAARLFHSSSVKATISSPGRPAVPSAFGFPAPPVKVTARGRLMGGNGSRMMITTAAAGEGSETATSASPAPVQGVPPSKEELKKRLSKEQFYVTQDKGTERAFTGKYWNEKRQGVYNCVCCSTPLFDSKTKFDSGTGWPSYYDKVGSNVKENKDFSIPFMPRVEVVCSTCDAHLGHVFNDGPRPTRLRYCINSASIQLDADAPKN